MDNSESTATTTLTDEDLVSSVIPPASCYTSDNNNGGTSSQHLPSANSNTSLDSLLNQSTNSHHHQQQQHQHHLNNHPSHQQSVQQQRQANILNENSRNGLNNVPPGTTTPVISLFKLKHFLYQPKFKPPFGQNAAASPANASATVTASTAGNLSLDSGGTTEWSKMIRETDLSV